MYTMMQVCRKLDMTYETLKYYCNEGLVPNVKRDKNNRRVFSERDVNWIHDLSCLKKCGFSIDEMKHYLDLCLEGRSSIQARQEILIKKQESINNEIIALRKSLDYIGWKMSFYNEILEGKREYTSNLIPAE